MAENCREQGCEEKSEFVCVCNPEVRLCQVHMVPHVRLPGVHRPILISEAVERQMSKAQDVVIRLDSRISEAYDHGKSMVQEILDKVNSVSEDMTKRQKLLLELANSGQLGPEIDREIMELSSVTLSLSRNQAFKRAIERHFSMEDGDQEDAFFREEMDILANHMNESNAITLRLLEKNHIENLEISRKIRHIESGTGLQATVEQMKKAFDQAQGENNEMKLKIHALEKEAQDSRKDISENKILSVSLKTDTITDIQALKREINDLRMINDSIVQQSQKSRAELERRIEALPTSDIFASIPIENANIKSKVAFIENQIAEINSQMGEAIVLVEERRKEMEMIATVQREAREKEEAELKLQQEIEQEAKEREQAELNAKEDEERIRRFAQENEERIKRFDVEKQKSLKILEKTEALEKELIDLIAKMESQLKQVIPKNMITQNDYNMIISDAPFVQDPSKLNEIQPEIKTIYAMISNNVRVLRGNNSAIHRYKDYAAPAADITAFNNDLTEIANLNDTLINTTIPQFEINKDSCKSFVAFMENPVIDKIVTNGLRYDSIKISNNREFYFFCKLYPDCKT